MSGVLDNPLTKLVQQGFPELDFAVLSHGFLPHGRDYYLTVQEALGRDPGTHSLLFTHVAKATLETRVRDDVWPKSWVDVFLDYEASVDMDGYVWGTNWSLAYPGISSLKDDAEASHWTTRLGKPMYAAEIETDRFHLRLIYHSVRMRRESDDVSLIEKVVIPLAP